MPRKNTVNFAQTIITAPSSGITTLIGTVVTSDTFPATNFYATIQQVVAGEIIKKEVVLCSTRTWTTFSVTRWQDGTSAQDFTTWGGVVYLVIATASAHIQDIRDKLDTVDTDIDTAEAKPATGKTTPIDADSIRLWDSVASNIKKFVTWSNIKATLKTYFDTLYHPINALRTGLTATRLLSTNGSGAETYIAPWSAGQFLNHNFAFAMPTVTNTMAILQNTRAINTATWTQVIAHWLWVTPKYVIAIANLGNVSQIATSTGYSNFSANWCTYYGVQWATHTTSNASRLMYIMHTNNWSWTNRQVQECTATADATNITLSRTYTVQSSTLTTSLNFTLFLFV